MSVAQLLYKDAGSPQQPDTEQTDQACAVCGDRNGYGIPAKKALRTNFASHGELSVQHSDFVCPACFWVMAGKPPDTLRMWSLVYRTDQPAPPNTSEKAKPAGPHIHLTSKADLRWAVETMLSPPESDWIVSIATSGQKHILPFAVVNNGSPWQVRLEANNVSGTPERLAVCLFVVGQLLQLGFYNSDIATLDPNIGRLIKIGIDVWKKAVSLIQHEHGGHLLELACACLNKEHTNEITGRAEAELERRGFDATRYRLHPGHDAQRIDGCDRPEEMVGESPDGAGDVGGSGDIVSPDGQQSERQAANSSAYRPHSQGDFFDLFDAD